MRNVKRKTWLVVFAFFAVAGGLLANWFGRSAPLPRDVEEARAELVRLAQDRPAFAVLAGVLHEVVPILHDEPGLEALPLLPADQASAKLAGGVPLLWGESPSLDAAAFRDGTRCRAACESVATATAADRPASAAEAADTMVAAWTLPPDALRAAVAAERRSCPSDRHRRPPQQAVRSARRDY